MNIITGNGFIKPDGTFIPVDQEGHWDYCIKHKTDKETLINKKRYIAVSYFYDTKWICFRKNTQPTQAQVDILFDWAKKHKAMYEYNLFLDGEYQTTEDYR